MNEKETRETISDAIGIAATHERAVDKVMEILSKSLSDQRAAIEKLIVDEILICHKENTPTSRLTSLAMKVKKL